MFQLYKRCYMNKKITAIIYALLAASLYAISIHCSKLLLSEVELTMLANFLYLGSGIGVLSLKLVSKKNNQFDKVTKKRFTIYNRYGCIRYFSTDIINVWTNR